MAKTDKPKRIRYTSPKGEALFAHVVHVDYGTDQYPNPAGAYNIMLALDEDDADKLRTMLAPELEAAQAFADEKFAALKPAVRTKLGGSKFNELGMDEYDKDETPTGRVLFRFKTNAFYENRQGVRVQRKVPLFDAMQQPVKLTDEPGNGSIIRVAFTAGPYFVDGTGTGGLTLYLDALQVVKLNKQGERSASDYGFGEEEGGFCGGVDDAHDIDALSSNAAPASCNDLTGNDDELPF